MDDLISDFITETTEGLNGLDLELVKLEKNPEDPALISSIFRLMHTIKGTCGFLGLPRLESTAHAGENVLGKIRDGELKATPEAVTLILESIDRIKLLIEHLGANGAEPEGSDAELIERLNMFADGGFETPAASVEIASEVEIVEEKHEVVEEVAEPKPQPQAVEKHEEKKDAATPAQASAPPAVQQSIRVNIEVLESLMQMVGELVLTRNQLLQISRGHKDTSSMLTTSLQRLSNITSDLQGSVMKTRMQPVESAWSKFPRLVRDLSRELGKKVELKMIGADTELDRQVLELIKDPLTHMVRNSVDHGLEMPDQRIAAGKSDTGTLTLNAYHQGGHIIIEIADDGRGLNIERIKEKALQNGLASQQELDSLNDSQIAQFIFKAGFSTAEKVTSVSGRGVGMDVVKTNIEKIGGSIDIRTVTGKGSTFSIKIPLTLAIISVLIVEAGGEKFAIPQIAVNEMVKASEDSGHKVEVINNTPLLRLREKLLPLVSLRNLLGMDNASPVERQSSYIAVCKVGSSSFGLVIDRVFDTEEIVVKPLAPMLKSIDVFSGCTILGDGSVILILDPNGIARRVGDDHQSETQQTAAEVHRKKMAERVVSFLIFNVANEGIKAVPLELVSRIEELDAAAIEYSTGKPVMQYRDGLMRLITLSEDVPLPASGVVLVIVFTFENKSIGLVVEQIIDVVDEKLDLKLASTSQKYIGGMVIDGKTTDVIDCGFILAEALDGQGADGAEKQPDLDREYNLLLADDSSFFRNMVGSFLSASGFNVVLAENGFEAMRILERGDKIDLVVSDIEMPVMNGYQFASACKADGRFSNLPLIAYTTRMTKDSVDRGFEAGFIEYIAKTDRDTLLQAARKYASERELVQ